MISMGKHLRRLRLKKRTSINSNLHFHKEKEMADFRKVFLVFVLLAMLLGAGTAYADTAFTCTANAGAPVLVRVEGITELIGDLLLQCTGGQPTPLGSQVPTSDIRLSLNTNVTSRLLGSSGFIDALLLIDDPYPNDSNGVDANNKSGATSGTHPGGGDANVIAGIIGNITIPTNSPFQTLCASRTQPTPGSAAVVGPPAVAAVPASCNYLLGTYTLANPNTAYTQANSPYLQANQTAQNASLPSHGPTTASTIYEARQVSVSAVEWDGVPIDAPGTTGVRVVRMTNVRANACQLSLSSTLIPTQIVGFIAVVGGQLFTINNPQQTLAFINQGLTVSGGQSTPGGNNSALQQCNNLTTGGGGICGTVNSSSSVVIAVTAINVREGFAQSFKRHAFSPDTAISGNGRVGTFSAI